ncbi:hypothetical protein SLS62_004554 [Diatrype stigma]|uniref:Uncharacterized protein n=1 Tax=Diatrype stigma TaxID=117547 RepID=A0AAN9V2V3_9PEZI
MIGTLKRALSIKAAPTRVEVVNPETGCLGATWLSTPRRPSQPQSHPPKQQPAYDGPHHAAPDRCRCLTTNDITQDVLRAHAEWLLARGLLAGPADVGPLILRLILRLPVAPELALPPEAYRDKSVRVKLPLGEVFPLRLERNSAGLESFPPLDESDLMLG